MSERDPLGQSFHSGREAVALVNLDGQIKDASDEYCRIIGFSCEEIIGRFSVEIGAWPLLENPKTAVQSLQEYGPVRELQFEFRNGAGEERVGLFSAEPWYEGGELAIRTSLKDVTESKLREMLKESETKYENLFRSLKSSKYPTVFVGMDGRILDANEPYIDLMGYPEEELVKRNVLTELTPRKWQKMESAIIKKQIKSRGYADEYQKEYVRKDGTVFPVLIIPWLLKDERGQAVGMWAIARDVTEKVRFKQTLLAETIKAQEGEAKRLALEIHDETLQSLSVIAIELGLLINNRDLPGHALINLKQLKTMVDSTSASVRRFSQTLRPDILDRFGLLPALELLVGELNEEGKCRAYIVQAGVERRLLPQAELQLFRIAQEALRNVRRHSAATEAKIKISFTPRTVKMIITDNGKGFEVPTVLSEYVYAAKLGLIGMGNRASLLNGRFSVESAVGKGTKVAVKVRA